MSVIRRFNYVCFICMGFQIVSQMRDRVRVQHALDYYNSHIVVSRISFFTNNQPRELWEIWKSYSYSILYSYFHEVICLIRLYDYHLQYKNVYIFSTNLLAFYHEYCSLIGYATHYPSCCRKCVRWSVCGCYSVFLPGFSALGSTGPIEKLKGGHEGEKRVIIYRHN